MIICCCLFTDNKKKKTAKKSKKCYRFCVFSRLGLTFPGSRIHQYEDMINGSDSDPCSYLLSSECVSFWLTGTGVVGDCSRVKPRESRTGGQFCVCVCARTVVRVITVGVSLMWHHRRGHITVSDSPGKERCSVGNEAPGAPARSEVVLSAVHDEGECASVCATDRKAWSKHGSAEQRLVSLFGLRCCWFVASHECVCFLLW